MKERWVQNPILSIGNTHIVDYPTPTNISYLWSFGSLAGMMLVIQIVTGIFLAMHYTPHVDLAFASVEHIMRDVNYGWLMRYMHANGASFFFIVVYLHIFRGLYYGSYMHPREHLWASGVTIFLLMMATAFIGYVLPWGQMSFWGATVITNLVSAIPGIGDSIVGWLWGGFTVDNPTLNRFFSLHYLLPFVIAGLALVHLVLLHQGGSNNPLGVDSKGDKIPFYPYFYVKDLLGFILLMFFYGLFVYWSPNSMGHPDNYIPANPMVTPAHIVPEWYFLPFYAILRSIPHKLGGFIAMIAAILVLRLLPYIHNSEVRSSTFRPIYRKFYWLFIADYAILGWIGQNEVAYPYVEVGQVASVYYFTFLLVIIPVRGYREQKMMRLQS
jgi:ubiquinol-cytochrome c reductase cytochrome b subunit